MLDIDVCGMPRMSPYASVFGYVVRGEEEGFLKQLESGDTIVKAEVVSGEDRLINGSR